MDEQVRKFLRKILKKLNPEIVIWYVGDPGAPSLGMLDPEILLWCEKQDFILVTNNRASMPVHLKDHLDSGRHIPGIFTLNNKMTMEETAIELILIWEASDPQEYMDHIRYLPISF